MVTQKKLEGMLSPLEERIQALEAAAEATAAQQEEVTAADDISNCTYVLCLTKDRFHRLGCESIDRCHDNHFMPVSWTRDQCIENHFVPCKKCNP